MSMRRAFGYGCLQNYNFIKYPFGLRASGYQDINNYKYLKRPLCRHGVLFVQHFYKPDPVQRVFSLQRLRLFTRYLDHNLDTVGG